MKSTDVFEWTFTPADCFEGDFTIPVEGHKINVTRGKARVAIDSEVFEADPTIRDRLHNALNDHRIGVELIKHRAVLLTGPERETVREDGCRILYAEMIASATAFGRFDVVATNAEGQIIHDSRRERIDSIKSLGDRIAAQRPKDRTLAKMIASYGAAMRDPGDELVHLYEIADALKARFKRRKDEQTVRGLKALIHLDPAIGVGLRCCATTTSFGRADTGASVPAHTGTRPPAS